MSEQLAAGSDSYLSVDYFTLLSQPVSFVVNKADLKPCYQKLQSQFHPDNYVSHSAAEQRLAMQIASRINQAYETLNSDVLRAAYLLELEGVDVGKEQTSSDVDFLMQQMMLREQLEEAANASDPEQRLEELHADAEKLAATLNGEFQSTYSVGDYSLAHQVYAKMQFIDKLLREVDQAFNRLLDD